MPERPINFIRQLLELQQKHKRQQRGYTVPPLVDYIKHTPPDFPVVDDWDPTNLGGFSGHAIPRTTVRKSR